MAEAMRPDVEALLAHAEWVRRFARALVADENDAADVEQETWRRAIERPPGHAANLRRWLASVARNAARKLGRAGSTRREKELRSAAGEVPVGHGSIGVAVSAADVTARAELHRKVVDAVLRLEELYRTPLLLRYFDDLPAQEVALRLGIPVETARTRIKRGIERLRESFDRDHHGERGAWCALLFPLTCIDVPARAAQAAALGGLLVGAQAKLVVGCTIGVGLITWMAWPGSSRPAADPAPGDAPVARGTDHPVRTPPEPETPERLAVTDPEIVLSGAVIAPDRTPIPSPRIEVVESGPTRDEDRVLAHAPGDGDGSFRIPIRPRPGAPVFLVARADGFWDQVVDVVPGEPSRVTLQWRAELFGRVRDARTNEPLHGVAIRANHRTDVTDAGGRYRVQDLSHGAETWLHATRIGYLETSRMVRMEAARETEHDFTLTPGHPVSLHVVDRESGESLVGANVLPFAGSEALGVTDGEGRFTLYVENGTGINVRVAAEGFAPAVWHYEIRDVRSEFAPRIPLIRCAWIEGTVTDDGGAPLSSVSVRAQNAARPDGRIEFTPEEQERFALPGYAYYVPPRDGTRTDDQGWFRLPVVPAGTEYHAKATHRGYAAAIAGPLRLEAAGSRTAADLVLRRGALVRGRVLRNGAPWPGSVVCTSRNGVEIGSAAIEEDGSYELVDVPPEPLTLFLRGNHEIGQPLSAELTPEPGETCQHDFAWNEELAAIRGRVTTPSDAPVADVEVYTQRLTPEGRYRYTTARTGADGRYELYVSPGDLYTVGLHREPMLLLQHEVRAGAEKVDFVLPPLANLRLRLVDAESLEPIGARLRGTVWMSWRRSGEAAFRPIRPQRSAEGLLAVDLPVGSVDVVLTFGDSGFMRADLAGLPVTETPVEAAIVPLARGTTAQFTFRNAAGEAARGLAGRVLFVLRDDELDQVRGPYGRQGAHSNFNVNGTILWLRDPGLGEALLEVDERGMARRSGLRPGRYTIRAFPDDVAFEPASFVVDRREPTATLSVEWWPR